jgi:hypothetical protein
MKVRAVIGFAILLATSTAGHTCSRQMVAIEMAKAASGFEDALRSEERRQESARVTQTSTEAADAALKVCHCYVAASFISEATMHLRGITEDYYPSEVIVYVRRAFEAYSLGAEQARVGLCGLTTERK